MTTGQTVAPTDAGQILYAALPTRAQVHVTRTKRLDHLAAQAFDRGWTLDQLVTRTTAGDLGVNPGGVITSRLEWCAENPPPRRARKPKARPFCSPDCAERGGWIEDSKTGLPTEKCPCRTGESVATEGTWRA